MIHPSPKACRTLLYTPSFFPFTQCAAISVGTLICNLYATY
jgi:hypothetical protein